MKLQIQSSGRFLSSMVMPNIGAFIAWGLITALFIPSGWLPNETLAQLVEPMLYYMLPLLIAYSGGSKTAGNMRGGVIGVIATMGVIAGGDVPMFIGAMMMGPAAGWIIRKFDNATEGRIKAGFEMLVKNFSLGIIGMLLAIVGFFVIGWLVTQLTMLLGAGVGWIMKNGLLPLIALFIEPAKVLFLNNALNHGILSPIGIEQAFQTGRSMMFLLEANPGPGMGVLMAYWAFGKGAERMSAPGAAIIHFFGGIHEIFFPYILARPVLILGTIAGSAAGIFFMNLFGGGLVAPASPGSIISVLAMSPKGGMWIVLCGVFISTVVSFLVCSPFIRRTGGKATADNNTRIAAAPVPDSEKPDAGTPAIKRVIFACDAGMGSSALGATRFRKRLGDTGVEVGYSSVDTIPQHTDVVVCQRVLAERAAKSSPESEIVVITNFMDDPALDRLAERISSQANSACAQHIPESDAANVAAAAHRDSEREVLARENIILGLPTESRDEAILRAGHILERAGYAGKGYSAAMLEREKITSTYMGMGLAIPHATAEAKGKVLHTGMVVLQYPGGVDFGGETAHLVIGIAGRGDEHLDILAQIAVAFDDPAKLDELFTTDDIESIYKTLSK